MHPQRVVSPLKKSLANERRMKLASIMPSAAEITVRKYFECVSNDFRDRFRPVGKSSRKAALFYLMRYYFLPQQHSIVLENIVPYSFV